MDDTPRDLPALNGYRRGRQLWAWCGHEQRWHQHGGPGHRGAHCACPRSPYDADGYLVVEAGLLTPAVLAAHPEHSACMECCSRDECSCGQPVCAAEATCGFCAQHADADCGSCWVAHGGPGYGACRRHGIVRMHPHRAANRCATGYPADPGAPCGFAEDVVSYWEAGRPAGHVHCPACWAEAVLSARTWRDLSAVIPGIPGVPSCAGCRKALEGSPWPARIARQLDEVMSWTGPPPDDGTGAADIARHLAAGASYACASGGPA